MIQQSETHSPLTLTPAHSLRERENYSQPPEKSYGYIYRTVSRKTNRSRLLFPLPGGESQGEDDRHH